MPENPRFTVSARPAGEVAADLVVVPVLEGPVPGPGGAEVERSMGVDLAAVLRRHRVTGRAGETLSVPGSTMSLLLVGVGPERDATTVGAVREAAMLAGAASRPHGTVASTLLAPVQASEIGLAAQAFSEGFLLGAHRYSGARTSAEPARTRAVQVLVPPEATTAARRGLKRGEITGGATNLARDLTNTSAAEATPAILAEEARAVAKELGLRCKVWTRAALERGGFGGILGVGRGSEHEPRMVELHYDGGGRSRPIAVTGKGITFDSGGLNLKKAAEMAWMRSDMAGAAAALATIRAVAELGVKANVVALLPFAENMPGPTAVRPGDVVRHRGGLTSEVLDTDAEGRVLLADVLAYLCEGRPSVILDSATLTDASGLGADLFAVMGNDREAVAEVLAAGAEAGEPGWEIPLWSRYRSLIDSPVADVKNVGDHQLDSAMLAGLFLERFVDERVPWVHLDTGTSAWAEHETAVWPEGATGSPTRAFVRFIERRSGGPRV
jgi:leucyl aminopeptidase